MGTTQPPVPSLPCPPAHRAAFPQEDAQPGPQPPHAEELLHRWGERWGGGGVLGGTRKIRGMGGTVPALQSLGGTWWYQGCASMGWWE